MIRLDQPNRRDRKRLDATEFGRQKPVNSRDDQLFRFSRGLAFLTLFLAFGRALFLGMLRVGS